MNPFHHLNDRRSFLKGLMLGAGSAALHPVLTESTAQAEEDKEAIVPENMLGEYGFNMKQSMTPTSPNNTRKEKFH